MSMSIIKSIAMICLVKSFIKEYDSLIPSFGCIDNIGDENQAAIKDEIEITIIHVREYIPNSSIVNSLDSRIKKKKLPALTNTCSKIPR